MSYRMEIYSNRASGFIWDVSELAHNIQYTSSLDGNPGKLSFVLEKDPNNILMMECGFGVRFYENDDLVFHGWIFTLGSDRTEAYKVTAYDILRYLKNHDTFAISEGEKSLHDVFKMICEQWNLEYEDLVLSAFGGEQTLKDLAANYLPKNNFNDMTLYDILSWCMTRAGNGEYDYGYGVRGSAIEQTVKGNKNYDADMDRDFIGAYYFLQSRNGKLCLNEITLNEKENPVIIGDESLLTDYEYELSIDKNTFNDIILVQESDSEKKDGKKKIKNKVLVASIKDDSTIKRWGRLNKTITIKDGATKAQIEEYLNLALQNYNQITKTLQIKAIGYPIYAGDTFWLRLKKLGADFKCYVIAATHDYGSHHVMNLEVSTNPKMQEIL